MASPTAITPALGLHIPPDRQSWYKFWPGDLDKDKNMLSLHEKEELCHLPTYNYLD